ncbi:hypothetical protein DL769_009267 [Monosporascus sp. CRB-8-3]|nr:hypothetical protein DL769_009267 [Monosporascus sp. CRB-8-3]
MGSSIALSDRAHQSGDAEQPADVTRPAGAEPPGMDEANNGARDSVVKPNPDSGYGWIVVFVCFVHTFWQNAWTGSWGILQVALLETTLSHSTSSTISFIGSFGIALSVALGIFTIRLARMIGARWISLIGILLYSISNIVSGWAVSNVGGLFIACLMYTMSNSLPLQWFSTKLGTANGIVKLGGGIGATVMAIVTGVLTERLGIAWTFRIFGLLSLATGVPPAFFIRERVPAHGSFDIDWSLFKDVAFSCLFASGVVGVFSIYAPPFFLPAVATSLGFSGSVVAGVVACFNACMAIGRLVSGLACDKFGSMNTLLLTMALNGVTMFAIWSSASTLAVLIVFSVLNGLANGAFFVALPTAVGRLAGERRGAGAISITLTGWTPGLLVGNPIAGFLIDATGARSSSSIVPYRPAIFYGGGTALLSLAFVVVARLWVDRRLVKKL